MARLSPVPRLKARHANSIRAENANSIYRRTIIETFGRRFYAGIRARF